MVDFETDDKVLAKLSTKQDAVKAKLIQKIKTEQQSLATIQKTRQFDLEFSFPDDNQT